MSLTYTCDYCGEEIYRDDPYVTFKVEGEHSDGRFTSGYVGHYHTDEHSGYRAILERENLNPADAPGDCWSAVNDALKLVHQLGQGVSSLPGGKVNRNEQRQSGTEGRTEFDDRHDAYDNWKSLELDQREPFVLEAIASGELTVGEICKAIGSRHDEFYVYEGTVRPLLKRMLESGKVQRRQEKWRGKIRYRYLRIETGAPDGAVV